MEKYNTLGDINQLTQKARIINNIDKNISFFNLKGVLPYKNSPYFLKIKNLYDNNIEFFTENEKLQIKKILQIIRDDSAPFALITGNPASGKSVFAYKIATEIEKSDRNYKVYYYTCREGVSQNDLINDLEFYRQVNPESKKLYIIDDIHLYPSKIFYFFNRIKSENIKCSILFVSRIVKSDFKGENFNENVKSTYEDIYEVLRSSTFQLEFSLYQATDSGDINVNKKIKSDLKSMNKIKGIVQKFSHKYNLLMPSNEALDNLFNKTGFDLLNLSYFLSVWKEEANINPNIELQLIDESDVLNHVYAENLSEKDPQEREVIIKYASMYQFEAWFEIQLDDYDIIYPLLKNGIIVRDNKIYSFYHSKFAELLLKSYIYCDDFFDIKYQNLIDLVIVNLSNYIKSYRYNRVRKFPNNIFELFDGMLGVRNRYLHNSIENNGIIFNTLMKDDEIKSIILDFFDNSDIEAINIMKFKDFVSKYAHEVYWYIEENLIYKDNFRWIKEKLTKIPSKDNFLAFVSFINEYEKLYYVFSDSEVKQMICSSNFSALRNLYGIENVLIRNRIKKVLTNEEWFSIFKNCNIGEIRITLTCIEKLDVEYASYLFNKILEEDLINKIKENFFLDLTYTIPVMLRLNSQKTKKIISEFNNDYIIKRAMEYIKNHNEGNSLQVFSDFIRKLYDVDVEKTLEFFLHFDFNEINVILTLYDIPKIISFLSEIKKVDEEKATNLFNCIDFNFLCDKIVKEPANKILNSISEIKYLDENRAKDIMLFAKETLIKSIPYIKLETFLSYEKNGILVMDKEITSEIMGRLPDDYIRKFYDLNDMRDLIRLISLYRYVNFSLWEKGYLLNEIFEYVDQNFTKKFLHKKWLPSTIRLLYVCSLFNRKIKSVSSVESEKVLKDILLTKGNLNHFIRNITVIKKHDEELAEELQLELSYQLNIIGDQMKGVGIFMNTILIEILKFVGASVSSGVTWDFLKKSSNNIIERFKKKFVEEKFFDNDMNCEEFFYKLCVNTSNNEEEPFDDVRTLYKKYAKGKTYDVFEIYFKKWLIENASNILEVNKENTNVSMFNNCIVNQQAKNINHIGVQNIGTQNY